ncbi:MAG: discoidin domain-containing protein [Myxococcota bacterium]|nr:discoidin domain-containing protein [Myxococcota bacterium]
MAIGILLTALMGNAEAANLKITGATASSTEEESNGVSYEPKNLKDSKRSTVWVEGESGSGLGSWVQVDLDGTQTINGIRLWNGNWYTGDFWQRHNRIKEILVTFSDGSTQRFTLKDEMMPEEIRFDAPVETSSVKIQIKGIYSGSTFNDTCLSEVQVFNDVSSENITAASYESSSNYPADVDGSYEPVQMQDSLLDTMWCEGDEGDGNGQWVQMNLGSSQAVSSLVIRNGNAYSFAQSMKSNRATAATVTFSDGATKNITLKASALEQVIDLGSHNTSSVRITVTEVKPGTEFNDMCISEAYVR